MILDQLLGSRGRAKILEYLLLEKACFQNEEELAQTISIPLRNVKKEIELLRSFGLIQKTDDGFFMLSEHSLLTSELRGMFQKERFLRKQEFFDSVRSFENIDLFILTGKFVGLVEETKTDILVVGRLNRWKFAKLIRAFEEEFGEELYYTIFSPQEFQYRLSLVDRFLADIFGNTHIPIVAKIDYGALSQHHIR